MKLAIKGHPTRGKEVIEILEMLGGINELDLKGIEADSHYYVGDSINKIYRGLSIYPYDYIVYTLEEFLEKFPYKVGDKVVYKIYGIYSRIKSMLWNKEKEQVFYLLDSNKLFVATADELKPLKEETIKESMENNINIAELLKDCPKGMELDCTKYSNVYFVGIDNYKKEPKIKLKIETFGTWCSELTLDKYGKESSHPNAKCIIFPKGKTTWEGFQRPFKDGDILATDLGSVFFLNMRHNTDEYYGCYVGVGLGSSFYICVPFAYKECCGLATEEEKEKLFDAIKANGYKWNAETKTLEKLPKFKVGDRIKEKQSNIIGEIIDVQKNKYNVRIDDKGLYLYFREQDSWELVPNKFDITILNHFDKVLVRDNDTQEWSISLFSHYNGLKNYKYSCINGNGYAQCIPYEGNEHLLGTTDDCDEYYKTWE